MEILIESILEPIFGLVLGLLGTAVAAISAGFVKFIFTKTKSDKLKAYSELLMEYAGQAVMSVAQTQTQLLGKALADGKLTADEKQLLKAAAMSKLRAIAPNAIVAFMGKVNSDVDTLMDTLVEAAVHKIGKE